jgi:cell division protein ZapA (FtsZ GTPase activity inhibitor)
VQIDIIKLAEIIGAFSVVLGVIIGSYKLYDKLLDRLDRVEQRVASLEQENRSIKKENTLVIYALGACLDGLHQQGCNGKVTEAIDKISKYINNAAHDQE